MNHTESQVDHAREISDSRSIDESFSQETDSDLIVTPAVLSAFQADEDFHKQLKLQAAKGAKS